MGLPRAFVSWADLRQFRPVLDSNISEARPCRTPRPKARSAGQTHPSSFAQDTYLGAIWRRTYWVWLGRYVCNAVVGRQYRSHWCATEPAKVERFHRSGSHLRILHPCSHCDCSRRISHVAAPAITRQCVADHGPESLASVPVTPSILGGRWPAFPAMIKPTDLAAPAEARFT